MAAQKGRTMIVSAGTSGSNTDIAGFQAHTMTLNNETVDVTNKGSSGYRELLEGAGTQTLSISGNGVFLDSASEETLRSNAFSDSIDAYTLEFPNGDTLECNFQISNYERSGEHNGAENFSCTFESSGQWTYTTN